MNKTKNSRLVRVTEVLKFLYTDFIGADYFSVLPLILIQFLACPFYVFGFNYVLPDMSVASWLFATVGAIGMVFLTVSLSRHLGLWYALAAMVYEAVFIYITSNIDGSKFIGESLPAGFAHAYIGAVIPGAVLVFSEIQKKLVRDRGLETDEIKALEAKHFAEIESLAAQHENIVEKLRESNKSGLDKALQAERENYEELSAAFERMQVANQKLRDDYTEAVEGEKNKNQKMVELSEINSQLKAVLMDRAVQKALYMYYNNSRMTEKMPDEVFEKIKEFTPAGFDYQTQSGRRSNQ